MNDNQKDTTKFIIEIATGIITFGIIPLIRFIRKVWESGAEERMARRDFRLKRIALRKDK